MDGQFICGQQIEELTHSNLVANFFNYIFDIDMELRLLIRTFGIESLVNLQKKCDLSYVSQYCYVMA